MNQFTPAQKNAIKTWTDQRDSLLREIGILTTKKEEEEKNCKEASESFQTIEKEIAEVRGRLAELDAAEEYRKNSLTNEVAELEVRKSRLESECEAKERESKIFDEKKQEKLASIDVLSMVHTKMADQAKIVDEVVGQVIKGSEKHVAKMQHMIAEVETVVTQVIEKSEKNVEQTNIVLDKLPKYIFELEKPIPLRKTFAAPKGARIEGNKT